MEKKLLFALDIGTRSVVGLVGEQTADGIKVLAFERQEHHTRAMLDGQIHDVPEVAQVLADVKGRLTEKFGPFKKVSVAAAGRSLCTLRTEAEIDCTGRNNLSVEDERALELAAIQSAQHQLATGNTVKDPASYYCVGYSVVNFSLDANNLKSLVGQRGKTARIELIATFLPCQVIDSLQSAIQQVGLEIATLTLEPIAAINVLIPTTMRHLNLALVDVGAGTSDVAITRGGSVIGYGMVPFAGDEITEALSQEYLLDFKVAEMLKRQLGNKNKKVSFTDILGNTRRPATEKIVERLLPAVTQLAEAIAAQIIALNSTPPQAVLLVGGGSLTPLLPAELAKALDIAAPRVAIRHPETVEGISCIPPELCAPDGVTPLGILKLAGSQSLNFVHVTLNGQSVRLFNLGKLSVADALLVAGIDVRSLHGRPGLGITVTINGEKNFVPGSLGESGHIQVNGVNASLTHVLHEDDTILVKKGRDGETAYPLLKDLTAIPEPYTITVNDELLAVGPIITVNGETATADTRLDDRDQVTCRVPETLAEVLTMADLDTGPAEYRYLINGIERSFRSWPEFWVNRQKAGPASPIHNNDRIAIPAVAFPTLAELLGLDEQTTEYYTIIFNGTECKIRIRNYTFTVDGSPANPTDIVPPNSLISYSCYEIMPMVSDVLLSAEYDPRSLPSTSRIEIRVNEQQAEYTTLVKNGDKVEIKILSA